MKLLKSWRIERTKNHGYPYLVGILDGKQIKTSPIIEVVGDGVCRTRNSTYRLDGHVNELDWLGMGGGK